MAKRRWGPVYECYHPGCGSQRSLRPRKQKTFKPRRLTSDTAYDYCGFHLDPANRETPMERRRRLLAEYA